MNGSILTEVCRKKGRVHCIGIGGIGVSAIARFFASEGCRVSGSDREENPVMKALREEGIAVQIGHDEGNVPPDTDMVVFSPAIPEENAERRAARKAGIPEMSYPEALGALSQTMRTVAVAGTHGKTTTTAMIAAVCAAAGMEPTVIAGSLLLPEKSNFIKGKPGGIFIVEACEYKRSFLHIAPDILVITNIEEDHLDYYKDLSDIQDAFSNLARSLPGEGTLVCNAGDPSLAPVIAATNGNMKDYEKDTRRIDMPAIGEHNQKNAHAAIAAAEALGISPETARGALSRFSGTWRRQEHKGRTEKGALVYDDYAHHPTEIRATLRAFREKFPDARILAIFQPHLYTRTRAFFDDFADSFTDADEVIIASIYAAREKRGDVSVREEDLARAIGAKARFVPSLEEIAAAIAARESGDIVLTIGAGDIYKAGERALRARKENNARK